MKKQSTTRTLQALTVVLGVGLGACQDGDTSASDTSNHAETTHHDTGEEHGPESEDSGTTSETNEPPCEASDLECWIDYCGQVEFPGATQDDCRALEVCDRMHVQELDGDACGPRLERCWPLDVSWGWSPVFDSGTGAPSAIRVDTPSMQAVFLFPIGPIPGPMGQVSTCSTEDPACLQCLSCEEQVEHLGLDPGDCA